MQVDYLRKVLPYARRFRNEKVVAYSPEDLSVVFAEVSNEGIFGPRGWKPQGDKFVWTARTSFSTDEIQLAFPVGYATISGTMQWSPKMETVDLVMHTRSPRDRLHILYEPQVGRIRLVCNGYTIQWADITPGRQQFQLTFGRDFDVIQPCDGVSWKVPAIDAAPGGFGLRVGGPRWDDTTAFAISNVRIQVTE